MARFQFNLPRRFDQAVFGSSHAAVSSRTLRALGLLADETPTPGPGWFDSSWELVRGLEVREGLPGDAPLDDWSAVSLAQWQPAPSTSFFAQRHEQPGAGFVPAPPHGVFGDALQLGDLAFAVAAEVKHLDPHLDPFSEFRIDGLELA